jgi:hypothetical protein
MQDKLLRKIYGQMQAWLGLVILTYLTLYLLQRLGKLSDTNSFGFGSPDWFLWTGAVVGAATMVLASVRPTRKRVKEIQLPILIVFLIFLLALAVLLTGGFINSPFSGAISLYLGFFMALIQARRYRGLSWVFVSLTVVCIVAPYVYLCWQNHSSVEILKWHASAATTAVRLLITISLLLVTGWFGGKVSSEVKHFSVSDSGQTSLS